MSVYEGVYKSLIQGVSQQTPQERADGQLGAQLNMLSDPVTGLRRRAGVKYADYLVDVKPHWYIQVINYLGTLMTIVIDTDAGYLYVYAGIENTILYSSTPIYYLTTPSGVSDIKTTVLNDNLYVLNTSKPLSYLGGTPTDKLDPSKHGYFSVRSTAFSVKFTLRLEYGGVSRDVYAFTSSGTAAEATPEYVATRLVETATGDAVLNNLFSFTRSGSTVAVVVKDLTSAGTLNVESLLSNTYMVASGVSRTPARTDLLGTLPSVLDNYVIAVGNTGNSAYYKYSVSTKTWSECGGYDFKTGVGNMPMRLQLSTDPTELLLESAIFTARTAGDDENNPYPSFIDYGLTGISSYQSRLVLLSGSYVYLSKSRDYTQFMRTTVTEVLDDDAIEVGSSALSAAQFEYAIPYNRDLVLISQKHQAVIPANSTVLSPKTAVIYPSTELDISLAVSPISVGRTLYYAYQRGSEYYQVGEFIPNTYTEGQYYAQNLTDHLPLYAEGVCTSIASSTTNNMVVMASGSTELLVNQFLWRGEERPLMAFHKWVMPYKVVYVEFIEDYLILMFDTGGGSIYTGTLNVQYNQLDDKPIPYLDMYRYVAIDSAGQGALRQIMPMDTAVIYDNVLSRHKSIAFKQSVDYIFNCPYEGTIAVGLQYESSFTLTPPFIKDDSGKVVAGTRTTIQQLRMTFKDTGAFSVLVQDTMGVAYTNSEDTALTWSETDLGYSWVNSIGAVVIPCRTRLSSTQCTVSTSGTTDLNLVSTEYVLRTASKRRRL